MLRRELLPSISLAAFAGLAAIVSLTALPSVVRACFALPLVLYVPGAALWSIVFPAQTRTVETRVLAVVLSLALTVLTGLALNAAGYLTPIGWAVALAGLTTFFVLVAALVRHSGLPAMIVGSATDIKQDNPFGGGWSRLAFAGAAALAICAIVLARHGAQAQHEYRYTELWMTAAPGDHPSLATLGLFNGEQTAVSYDVDILLDHGLVDRWPPISLKPGETRTIQLALPQKKLGAQVEAQLFREGDRSSVYRKVWIAVPSNRSTAEQAAAKAAIFDPDDPDQLEVPGKMPIFKSQVSPKAILPEAEITSPPLVDSASQNPKE